MMTSSLQFEWLWAFALLPLPLVVRLLPPSAAADQAALRVPRLQPFTLGLAVARNTAGGRGFWLAFLAWLLLICAVARPLWLGAPVDIPISGRDLLLAVDISGSMKTPDFVIDGQSVTRLDAVKKLAGEFIQRRAGDRVGLVLFGTQAYLQTPLTFDRKTVNAMLQESAIGLAGPATAIGDAIGLAIKRLKQNPGSKVLILLTDGASNAGEVAPLEAAQMAAKAGLTIYTIGIGADEMEVNTFFGRQRVKVPSDLDEPNLRAIAAATGGRYFRASDAAALAEIYGTLDQLQPAARDKQTFRPQQALFYWPLAASLLLAGWLMLLRGTRWNV